MGDHRFSIVLDGLVLRHGVEDADTLDAAETQARPTQVNLYVRAFDRLAEHAVQGRRHGG